MVHGANDVRNSSEVHKGRRLTIHHHGIKGSKNTQVEILDVSVDPLSIKLHVVSVDETRMKEMFY
jgi:hypothetical protein